MTIVLPTGVITSDTLAGTVWTAHFFPTWIDAILEMLMRAALIDADGTLVFWNTDTSDRGWVDGWIVAVIHSLESWNTVTCFNIDATFSNSVRRTSGAPTHDFVLGAAWFTTRRAH